MITTQSFHQFADRHIGPDAAETAAMLATIGVGTLGELVDETVPSGIRLPDALQVPRAKSEYEYLQSLKGIAAKNKAFRSFIGMGYYGTVTPSVILRNIFENPGWYTQYTPYQSEIAQGRLEALLNFQTMVCDLTAMPVANASLLDEATAAAEAMAMMFSLNAKKVKGKTRHRFLVCEGVLPQTVDVLLTRAEPIGIEVVVANWKTFYDQLDGAFGLLLQYPNTDGAVEDYRALAAAAHRQEVAVIVAADLLALALLLPPGEWGADVVVGSSQRFGVPMGFGGPHAAFFATKEAFKRSLPGRIIGISKDAHGNLALRMALQTREQHIRREKATSNICTAQVLLAIMSSMYAVYHGQGGIRQIATRIHGNAQYLANALAEMGYENLNTGFFDTLLVNVGDQQGDIVRKATAAAVNFRVAEKDKIGIALDETTTQTDLEVIINIFAKARGRAVGVSVLPTEGFAAYRFAPTLVRTSNYLTHPVFSAHQSETKMMRYIKFLENKDLSLNQSMIALGSCTMKLNAATELMPVSWEAFGGLHPFVPLEQAAGYLEIFRFLENALCQVTGFAACSLQPNSGAQGEFAGLLTIRAYHRANGNAHRNVALIPSSAHGTNPASAVMAGMKVVVVRCDERGNIALDDLRQKAEQHSSYLAALMVTYPSTHGVFETRIREICDLIHEHGGKVYMDGANMNAQVGLTSPAAIGADVCHLNLHKTFAIPHGGGGPGMGPICVNESLAPFLPQHSVVNMGLPTGIRAVSAAPWGSASILLISYGYIQMLGGEGITRATEYAILNANYVAARLQAHFPILYTGEKGRSAHELIVDLRQFKPLGVEAEDVAKRLMDYGFHAPTLSFPVAGTIMIEPTESEGKEELDRFCDALIAIRREIDEIARGEADAHDNVLKNAPHTLAVVTADTWAYPYSRQKAAFPLPFVRTNKFWASVGRVDNAAGDRVLICTCPPVASYAVE